MKKTIIGIAICGVVALGTTTVYGIATHHKVENNKKNCDNTCPQNTSNFIIRHKENQKECNNFTDIDEDGLCDNMENNINSQTCGEECNCGANNSNGNCQKYSDEDNDGTCDNMKERKHNMKHRNNHN